VKWGSAARAQVRPRNKGSACVTRAAAASDASRCWYCCSNSREVVEGAEEASKQVRAACRGPGNTSAKAMQSTMRAIACTHILTRQEQQQQHKMTTAPAVGPLYQHCCVMLDYRCAGGGVFGRLSSPDGAAGGGRGGGRAGAGRGGGGPYQPNQQVTTQQSSTHADSTHHALELPDVFVRFGIERHCASLQRDVARCVSCATSAGMNAAVSRD
jgi:hypothetical protein